jgi:hypothetical protein
MEYLYNILFIINQNINSACAVIKIKPEIVTGQYNSSSGISNVIFPGGHGK